MAEINAWVVMVVFKARELHTGYSPTTPSASESFVAYSATSPPEESPKNFFELCDAAYTYVGAPNRLAFVPYFGTGACDHTAPSSIFPPTGFANSEMCNPTKTYPLNFLEHGQELLGDIHAFNNRMARELLYHAWNVAEKKGSRINAADFMKAYQYQDEEGDWHFPQVPLWNPRNDEEYVLEMTRRYQHHRNISYEYLIPLRKPDLKKNKTGANQELVTLPILQPLAEVVAKFHPQSTVSQAVQSEKSGKDQTVPGPEDESNNNSQREYEKGTQAEKEFEYYDSQGESEVDNEDEDEDEKKTQAGKGLGYVSQGEVDDESDKDGHGHGDEVELEYVVEKILDIQYDEVNYISFFFQLELIQSTGWK